jgi:hypothetical protein
MVSTRNDTRNLLLQSSSDVEMEGDTTPLSPEATNPGKVVALHSADAAEHYPVHAVHPATHPEPTL